MRRVHRKNGIECCSYCPQCIPTDLYTAVSSTYSSTLLRGCELSCHVSQPVFKLYGSFFRYGRVHIIILPITKLYKYCFNKLFSSNNYLVCVSYRRLLHCFVAVSAAWSALRSQPLSAVPKPLFKESNGWMVAPSLGEPDSLSKKENLWWIEMKHTLFWQHGHRMWLSHLEQHRRPVLRCWEMSWCAHCPTDYFSINSSIKC